MNPRSGAITRIVDISAMLGHIVPTAVVERHGALYRRFGVFPVIPGQQKILRISRSGAVSVVAEGFTTVLGLEFDGHGRLYVLGAPTWPDSRRRALDASCGSIATATVM